MFYTLMRLSKMDKNRFLFTIFTPTYNRAYILPRLYESIRKQTFRDFEWIIVDDGSTDNTRELVESWQRENNDFPIRYFWQPNQHKKVAFNRAVFHARGKYFVVIDDDDELLPDALEQFKRMWETIPAEKLDEYAGILSLCLDDYGKIVGSPFPYEPLDGTFVEIYFKYKYEGEKHICLRTDVAKQYPYPEDIPNYVPDALAYLRMSGKYKFRCFNTATRIYHCDIDESGSRPKDPLKTCRMRAQARSLYFSEGLDWIDWKMFLMSPLRIIYFAVNYNRYSLYLKPEERRFKPSKVFARILGYLKKPLGLFMYAMDPLRITTKIRKTLEKLGIRFY